MASQTFPLFTMRGLDVRGHVSWILALPLLAVSLYRAVFPFLVPGLPAASYAAMAALGTVGYVILLLMRDGLRLAAARWAGVGERRLTLYVFGAVGTPAAPPRSVKAELLVLLLAVLAGVVPGSLILIALFKLAGADLLLVWSGVALFLGFAGFGLGVLPLIPALPLEAGRVVRAVLAWWMEDPARAGRSAAIIGVCVGILGAAWGAFVLVTGSTHNGLWLLLLGLLAAHAAQRNLVQVE